MLHLDPFGAYSSLQARIICLVWCLQSHMHVCAVKVRACFLIPMCVSVFLPFPVFCLHYYTLHLGQMMAEVGLKGTILLSGNSHHACFCTFTGRGECGGGDDDGGDDDDGHHSLPASSCLQCTSSLARPPLAASTLNEVTSGCSHIHSHTNPHIL